MRAISFVFHRAGRPALGASRLATGAALAALGLTIGITLAVEAARGARPLPDALRLEETPAVAGTAARPTAGREHVARTVHFDILSKLLADDRRGDDAWREQLADPRASCRVETQHHQLVGQMAPDFTLCDVENRSWNLRQKTADGPLVLIFYLGYSCNACVHNLCELNADLARFESLGAQVAAISGDRPELTQQRFEQFGSFGFTVLSDPDHAVAGQFGTYRPAGSASETDSESGELLHGTFIVDREGIVRWANRGELPFRDDLALLYELAHLEDRFSPQPAEATVP
jgi:peroxiredoxin